MSNKMSISGLFPIPVGFDEYNELTPQQAQFLRNTSNNIVNNDGNFTSEDSFVLNHPIMGDLKNYITQSINQFFYETRKPSEPELHLQITQSWMNFSKPGQYHHRHSHPNSYISGVYYLDAEDGVDEIMFHDELRPQIFGVPTNQWNQYNSLTWKFNVRRGLIVLFPSYFHHSVPSTRSSNIRSSLAFNSFFKGNVGNIRSLTHLTVV